ncbi:hypothetical protein QTP70_016770 [Hemibagrus guttatus]|uniref:Uncharacterized protein n=1 Tax=Hemibagrus guttatus TaxID=175788 RepID=A0AAE0QRG2_9TELE|nr:hypothetical protein QTP70_016770 [Hemibagrus guttatus]KAK3559779.1 hypothetical protein QTP86_020730 [Hemibagrus guttatus]
MMLTNALVVFVLAVALMVTEGSWVTGSDKGSSHSYDLSNPSDLKKLYNSKVYHAERLTRPLKGFGFQAGIVNDFRVTLGDGTKWLVHKGNAFGISSQTVVVDAKHMSNSWKIKEAKNFGGSKTVSDFVKAGGTSYNLLFDNCHNAANRMMEANTPQM